MATRDQYRERSYAVHEAGHAVVAIEMGCHVLDATIVPSQGYEGYVTHTRASDNAVFVTAFGGAAAQEVFGYLSQISSVDADNANSINPRDWAQIDALRVAECIIRERAAAVNAIARALIERRTLTGTEVHQIFQAHKWAPSPLPRN